MLQLRVPISDVTTTQIEVLSVLPVGLQPEAAQQRWARRYSKSLTTTEFDFFPSGFIT